MPSSKGCKVMGHQSWWSKKILDLLGPRLRFQQFYYCKFGLWATWIQFPVAANFEGLQFWSLWARSVKNKFFEGSDLFLLI